MKGKAKHNLKPNHFWGPLVEDKPTCSRHTAQREPEGWILFSPALLCSKYCCIQGSTSPTPVPFMGIAYPAGPRQAARVGGTFLKCGSLDGYPCQFEAPKWWTFFFTEFCPFQGPTGPKLPPQPKVNGLPGPRRGFSSRVLGRRGLRGCAGREHGGRLLQPPDREQHRRSFLDGSKKSQPCSTI